MCCNIFILSPKDTDIFEIQFGYDFSKRYIKKNMQDQINFISGDERLKDLPITEKIVFFVFDNTCVPSIFVKDALIDVINSGYELATCVTNETDNTHQQAEIPYMYYNMGTFYEVAEIMFNRGKKIRSVDQIDPFLFAVNTDSIDPDIPVKNIPDLPLKKGIAQNVLVHRFGENLFLSPRDDLIPFVPDECKKILDIGCARGGFGKNLKIHKKGIEITGIELSPSLAEDAKKHYNRVIVQDVMEVDLEDKFDLVVCGDLIEHVYDPWKLLKKIHFWLRPGGYFLACVPNIGHWSAARDLLNGKFEYILLGLLCVGHIRFFTQESLKEMLMESGFEIKTFHKNIFPPTPEGEKFISRIKDESLGDIESLKTFSYTFVAKKSC
ncbi:MAG: class I SAM-dependent methyltransferase [Desulfonauticus sp.]|nr:class I SAM-dependent methyltransferase [Desulfonauticus sp.]